MEKEEFEKTVELLTPKYRKSSCFVFGRNNNHKRLNGVWRRITSIAAMVAVIVGVGIYTLIPVRAEEIIRESLMEFNSSNTYKVKFYAHKKLFKDLQLQDEVKNIEGILYTVKNTDGHEMNRVELQNIQDKWVIIYDGQYCRHYKNNVLVKKSPSTSLDLLDFFKLDVAKYKTNLDISEQGDSIVLSHKKGDVVMYGVFSRTTKRLIEAYVTAPSGDRILGTNLIEYNTDLPSDLFK